MCTICTKALRQTTILERDNICIGSCCDHLPTSARPTNNCIVLSYCICSICTTAVIILLLQEAEGWNSFHQLLKWLNGTWTTTPLIIAQGLRRHGSYIAKESWWHFHTSRLLPLTITGPTNCLSVQVSLGSLRFELYQAVMLIWRSHVHHDEFSWIHRFDNFIFFINQKPNHP